MTLKQELTSEVGQIFRSSWTERDGEVVPESEDLRLGNDAVKFEAATCLYADLAESTLLVDTKKPQFAAEIYKAFLLCAAKILRSRGGVITAYDGDRIMAVYIGNTQNTSAVRSAMEINYAVREVVTPLMAAGKWSQVNYALNYAVGIDRSKVLIARTGVRGANDLVWVGRGANYAAKMATIRRTYRTFITPDVYNNMDSSVKSLNGRSMWDQLRWDEYDKSSIYGSTWWWPFD